jgi:uracil-DNA glycosylase
MLLGEEAQRKAPLIDESKHLVLRAAHPSQPELFRGCRCYVRANEYLAAHGKEPIDWRLPELWLNGS